jgi:hypothetical protein
LNKKKKTSEGKYFALRREQEGLLAPKGTDRGAQLLMSYSHNQLYKPLVEDPEAGPADAPPLRSYAPTESRCAKLGGIARKIFCCCGLCDKVFAKVPDCGLRARWTKVKGFLCQSSSVCQMGWLICFLLTVVVFAILMATLLSRVDDPYN